MIIVVVVTINIKVKFQEFLDLSYKQNSDQLKLCRKTVCTTITIKKKENYGIYLRPLGVVSMTTSSGPVPAIVYPIISIQYSVFGFNPLSVLDVAAR